MTAEYKRSEINATLSVTNIHYSGTLTINSEYSMCRNVLLSEKTQVNRSTLLKNYLEGNSVCAEFENNEKSFYENFGSNDQCPCDARNRDGNHHKFNSDTDCHCENADKGLDWIVSEHVTERSQNSYVDDEELKEVFAQFKSAIVSTSNSEISLCSVPSDTTVANSEIQGDPKQWDREKLKKSYNSQKSQTDESEDFHVSAERTDDSEIINEHLQDYRKEFFGKVKFNGEILEKLKFRQVDTSDVDVNSKVYKTPSDENSTQRRYTYTDNRTWLYKNLTTEQIKEYWKQKELKMLFSPECLSRRVSNQLKHKEVNEVTRPNEFKKLDFKYEPHAKFPAFGEGKYATTAVSKNYTFTPTQQMEINRANFILDQRLMELKKRKSNIKASAQKHTKIKLDQTSSYINRMKEYRRINIENKKLVKKFNPDQICTTRQLMNRGSASSICDKSSVSTSSSATKFSSKMYTKAYNQKIVKRLAHSKNQYAADKSPSKVPKKYKRPEWNIDHVDYKKKEVKPIKYKSIRKLPVSFYHSNATLHSQSSRYSESTNSFGIPCKPRTAPTLGSANSSATRNECRDVNKCVRSLSEQNKSYRKVQNTQNNVNKSRIPVRRLNESRNMDLNSEKFKVFQSLNKALFGSHNNESRHKNVYSKNEVKAGQVQTQVEKRRTEDNNMTGECQEFVNIEDTNFFSLEMGGGDATRALFCSISDNSEDSTLQKSFENNCPNLTLDLPSDSRNIHLDFDFSDQEETLSTTSSVYMEQESEFTFPPQFLTPKQTFMDDSIKSTSFSIVRRRSFSNNLDIISERTESSISDDDKNDEDTNLNCLIGNIRDEHKNLNESSGRVRDVSDEVDSLENTKLNFAPQENNPKISNYLRNLGNIKEETPCLSKIRHAKIATQLNLLNTAPKPSVPEGTFFSIVTGTCGKMDESNPDRKSVILNGIEEASEDEFEEEDVEYESDDQQLEE